MAPAAKRFPLFLLGTSLCGCRPFSRRVVAVQDIFDPSTLAEEAATCVDVLISTSMLARASSMLNTPSAACSAVETVCTSCLDLKPCQLNCLEMLVAVHALGHNQMLLGQAFQEHHQGVLPGIPICLLPSI